MVMPATWLVRIRARTRSVFQAKKRVCDDHCVEFGEIFPSGVQGKCA